MTQPSPDPERSDTGQGNGPAEEVAPQADEPELVAVNPPPTLEGPLLEQSEEGAIFRIWAQASFSGPLPPPSMLAEYNKVHPGASDVSLSLPEPNSAWRLRSSNTATS